jgi:hypothetical protein
MSEGTRFKTGFLPARTSFTSLGMKLGEDIAESVQAIQNERLVKQHRLNTTMGFTKALDEAVPAGLTGKYNDGAQKLLDAYQGAATKAYRTGNQADVDEYQRLKNDFVEFKNISTAKSALDNQTRLSIAQGNYKNLSGTIEQNLEAYSDFASAEYRFDDVTRELQVKTENGFVPWRTSNIGDLNDVFVPKTLWQGTEYMPENMGNAIYEDVLKARELVYQNRTDFGFADGTLNEAAVYADIDANLQSKFAVRGSEMMEAIAVTGYKNLQKPGATQLTESDLSEAGVLYNEQEIFVDIPDVGNIGTGKLNSSGEWVFDLSDEQIQEGMAKMNMGAASRQYIERRKAIKLYMEESATKAFDRVQRDYQIAQDLSARRSEAATQARLDKAEKDAIVTYSPISTFKGKGVEKNVDFTEGSLDQPALKTIDDVTKVKASVPGRQYKFTIAGSALPTEVDAQGNEIKVKEGQEGALDEALKGDIKVEVTNVLYNNRTGEMDGFELATGPGVLEGFFLDIDGTPIKSFVVKRDINPDAFQEIETSIRQVAAPSKTKRSGNQFLNDAQRSAFIDMDIEPPSDEALERSNSYMGALQSIVRQQGMDKAGEIADIVSGLRLDERIAMETRIFESVQQGVLPTVEDGEIKFPE